MLTGVRVEKFPVEHVWCERTKSRFNSFRVLLVDKLKQRKNSATGEILNTKSQSVFAGDGFEFFRQAMVGNHQQRTRNKRPVAGHGTDFLHGSLAISIVGKIVRSVLLASRVAVDRGLSRNRYGGHKVVIRLETIYQRD